MDEYKRRCLNGRQYVKSFQKQYNIVNGTAYDSRTPQAVIDVLERARRDGKRIRVFYGDIDTGRDWLEENDVMGYVGRSTGQYKIPLLITNSKSISGASILDHCIVRITIDRREVYRHPSYHVGELTVRPITMRELLEKGYTYAVDVDGRNHANFKIEDKARRFVKFLLGELNRY